VAKEGGNSAPFMDSNRLVLERGREGDISLMSCLKGVICKMLYFMIIVGMNL
jgi:hypothetical protein